MKDLLRRLKHRMFPPYVSPADYWRNRYRKYGTLQASGCVTRDEARNQVDYVAKWEHISAGLPERNRGRTLLDAGCGSGAFTAQFLSLGYTVTAVDFAATALQQARRPIGDDVAWYQARAADARVETGEVRHNELVVEDNTKDLLRFAREMPGTKEA